VHHVWLVPGFFGFANLGDLRYFSHVLEILPTLFAERGETVDIRVVGTSPTASLPRRASVLLETMAATLPDDGPLHLIGHSSGGLDCRLLCTPDVVLPSATDPAPVAARVRSVVTVATPHHGTPLAGFFASLLGQRLLRLLSLSTVYALRVGRLPLSALLGLGTAFANVDGRLGLNSVLLDELFTQLLSDLSPDRREALGLFFGEVEKDQALLPQLMPESMAVFNALARDRPGTRYADVVARARTPGVGSTLEVGLDPSAHATHVVYQALHRLTRTPPEQVAPLTDAQANALRAAYGDIPDADANDGVVPTRSQVWGRVLHATRADHLDVLGHFGDPTSVPPHVDWLTTGTGFDGPAFDALWTSVADFLLSDEA
jgi:triacylglycerol lipase